MKRIIRNGAPFALILLSIASAVMVYIFFVEITFPRKVVGGITEFDRAMAPWNVIACFMYAGLSLSFALSGILFRKTEKGNLIFLLLLSVWLITTIGIFILIPHYFREILHLNYGQGG